MATHSEGSRRSKSASLSDLYNFEEARFEGSQYILTSPRSLEACSRMKIKPVELLHKPLSEFETELKSLGLSHTAMFAAYQKYERQRLDKLQRARDERQKRKQAALDVRGTSRMTVTTAEKPGVIPHENKQTTQHITPKSTVSVKPSVTPNTFPGVSSRPRDLELVGQSIHIHSGRSQSSHSKLNEMKPHNMQGYTTEDKQGPSKSKPFSVTSKAQRLRPKSEKGKRERPRMATNGMAWGVSSVDADVGVSVRKSKSEEWQKVAGKSFSDLTLNDLPAKDRRILELMIARREEEQILAEKKNAFSLECSKEMLHAKQEQEISDRKYREELERLKRQARERREKERLRKEAEERDEVEMRTVGIERESQGWQERAARIEQERLQRIEMKKLEDSQKKRIQETRLQEKEKEDEILRSATEQRLEEDLKRAQQVRQEREDEKKLQVQVKNMTKRHEYEQRRAAVEQQCSDEVDYKKSVLEVKHARAADQVQQSLAQRDETIRINRLKRMQREHVRQAAVGQMEEELDVWRQGISACQQEALEKARVIATEKVTEKSRSAQAKRLIKDHEHKQNLLKVREEEEEWRKQTECEVWTRELRTEAILAEKDLQIQQSRQVARATEYMRSKVTGEGRPIEKMPFESRRLGTTQSKHHTRDSSNLLLG
ncbi:coiled-coil domain-containing protein 177-like isoform X2 [Corticium candelabrum]|uniref:coiled-coil domain-containing protein 177-like isoform X2 n=1 Tax=Corticium candelabrum TaxID=121492 RepID=UPI002E2689D3|nr:coiled-coil domain-containing protein 177-like isoform X2 [Corticium candelabrum]